MVEHCNEHVPLTEKVGQVQIDMATLKESNKNIEMSIIQVMKELQTRKLSPIVVWILSIMSGALGIMTTIIFTHILNK